MRLLLGWPVGTDETGIWPGAVNGVIVAAPDAASFERRLTERFDVIAVHAELFTAVYPWDWLHAIKYLNPDAEVFVALSDKSYGSLYSDVITELAGAFGYKLLPLGLTSAEALRQLISQTGAVRQSAVKRAGGRLIAVSACSPKDGATTVAVHTALELAARSSLKVGLLDLNLKSPAIGHMLDLPFNGKQLMALRPACMAGTLTATQLSAGCVKYRRASDLYVLPGSSRRDTAGDYALEHMEVLMAAAREAFDVVIADVHTFPDNAATVYAVKHADERWLVAQPAHLTVRASWAEWYECVWRHCGLSRDDFKLIVNRSDAAMAVKPAALAAAAGAPLLATVSNAAGGAGLKAGDIGVPLGRLEGTELFNRDIGSLVRQLAARCGAELPAEADHSAKGAFRQWMQTVFSMWT